MYRFFKSIFKSRSQSKSSIYLIHTKHTLTHIQYFPNHAKHTHIICCDFDLTWPQYGQIDLEMCWISGQNTNLVENDNKISFNPKKHVSMVWGNFGSVTLSIQAEEPCRSTAHCLKHVCIAVVDIPASPRLTLCI